MLENETKGWHGSYSVIGRNIVERFQLLLRKDEILSDKLKKVVVKDFFSTTEKEDKKPEKNKKNKNKEIDIFSESYDTIKNERMKIINEKRKINQSDLCGFISKDELKEKYKYHQSHHGHINNKKIKRRQKNIKTLASYYPKMDFIWKKVKTGPSWKLLKGREKIVNTNNISLYKNKKVKGVYHSIHKGIISNNLKIRDAMDKQTKRGQLPVYYDLRIRTDKPFIPKNKIKINNNKKVNDNSEINIDDNNNNKNSVINLKDKFSITPKKAQTQYNISENNNNKEYLNTYSNKFSLNQSKKILNSDDISRNKNKLMNYNNNNLKLFNLKNKSDNKNINLSPIKNNKNILNHTIDFSKILPRNTNIFLTQNKHQSIHPISNPSYKLIEPRSLTMVSYSKKIKGKSTPKKFVGVDPHLFYDANKVINKINNHKEINAPNFNIMTGRNWDSGPLPAFMVKLCDRKSLEIMTDKGLKMNNYANLDFQKNSSTFHPKKSFNKVINYTLFKKNDEILEEELKKINDEIFCDKKIKKMIERYYEDETKNKEYPGIKFDEITLKTIKNENRKKPLAFEF